MEPKRSELIFILYHVESLVTLSFGIKYAAPLSDIKTASLQKLFDIV